MSIPTVVVAAVGVAVFMRSVVLHDPSTKTQKARSLEGVTERVFCGHEVPR